MKARSRWHLSLTSQEKRIMIGRRKIYIIPRDNLIPYEIIRSRHYRKIETKILRLGNHIKILGMIEYCSINCAHIYFGFLTDGVTAQSLIISPKLQNKYNLGFKCLFDSKAQFCLRYLCFHHWEPLQWFPNWKVHQNPLKADEIEIWGLRL